MLMSVSDLKDQILTLPPSDNSHQAATNFINVVAAFMNQVQAGSLGTPGIFTYNKPPAISMIEALPPVKDNSWISNFANAIHAGVTSGTLTTGTVSDPSVWTASTVDVEPPTIITLSAALSTLISELSNVTSSNNPPMPLAQAIHDYTTAWTFECIGLATAGSGTTPVPLTFPAQ